MILLYGIEHELLMVHSLCFERPSQSVPRKHSLWRIHSFMDFFPWTAPVVSCFPSLSFASCSLQKGRNICSSPVYNFQNTSLHAFFFSWPNLHHFTKVNMVKHVFLNRTESTNSVLGGTYTQSTWEKVNRSSCSYPSCSLSAALSSNSPRMGRF